VLPGFGLLAPLLVWRSERDQQRETAFQALQALGWQVLQVFFVQVTALILGLSIFSSLWFQALPAWWTMLMG